MAMEEDTESCGSRAVDWSASSRNQHDPKLQAFNDVLQRLQDCGCPDALLSGFPQRLWLHFNRLPARYALEVNVERAEDVVTHMRLLRRAQDDPINSLSYDLRLVQVGTATNGHAGNSVHSCSVDEGSEGSVKNSFLLGLSLSLHPPPTFGSIQNFGPVGVQLNVEDKNSCVNNITSHFLRPMHEITFSAVDKPKLLSQLTSLLSEMSLNIQEGHAFSTVDGFSLDVFVVDGWPHEETEQLRNLLDKEIRKIKPQHKEILLEAVDDHCHESSKCLQKNAVVKARQNDDIDPKCLKIGFQVASGSYGDLYRGTYCGQGVAIKILKPAFLNADVLKEFFQEVHIMRKIHHKNVVPFIGACTKPPNMFIVTEFMPKGNLFDYIHKRNGVFRFESLIRAAIDISKGMDYLHQNDIIHRDLKTANLLMNEDRVIKVADFGVARVQTRSGVMTAETGTYRWMAPEVIGHKPYNHKADVFSFGIVLWELLTGELPYSHLTPLQAAIGVVQKGLRPAIPNHTHPRLADLLERCWHQDPNIRPNFSVIIEILQQIGAEIEESRDGSRQEQLSDECH